MGEITAIKPETPRVKSLFIDLSGWPGHRAGQHVDVRLTAEDGYQAVRSYSIASPPEERLLELTVEDLSEGEVSPYLVEEVRPGDHLEFRGPIGGYFVWETRMGGPLLLVGGGSGVVPLMAMLRHRVASGSDVPVRLLYSTRRPEDMIYRQELDDLNTLPGIEIIHTYTRAQPLGWTGFSRRIDAALLREVSWPASEGPLAYVCGPTGFVEAGAAGLLAAGLVPERIRTERFGPTGA